jgi:hypothetical protein
LARESESNAQRSLAQKDYDRAADSYIQAAFLYQKMIDLAR